MISKYINTEKAFNYDRSNFVAHRLLKMTKVWKKRLPYICFLSEVVKGNNKGNPKSNLTYHFLHWGFVCDTMPSWWFQNPVNNLNLYSQFHLITNSNVMAWHDQKYELKFLPRTYVHILHPNASLRVFRDGWYCTATCWWKKSYYIFVASP